MRGMVSAALWSGIEAANVKDFWLIELWDDIAIQVESNTGIPVAFRKDRNRRVELTSSRD